MNKKEQEDQLRRRTKALADYRAKMLRVDQELESLRDRLDGQLSNWATDLVKRYKDEQGGEGEKKTAVDLD